MTYPFADYILWKRIFSFTPVVSPLSVFYFNLASSFFFRSARDVSLDAMASDVLVEAVSVLEELVSAGFNLRSISLSLDVSVSLVKTFPPVLTTKNGTFDNATVYRFVVPYLREQSFSDICIRVFQRTIRSTSSEFLQMNP